MGVSYAPEPPGVLLVLGEGRHARGCIGKELRGEGERNAQGEREGRGTMVYASGSMYEGQWLAGKRHGQGKFTYASGIDYD